MKLNPSAVLREARKAFKDNDYEVALEKYAWFFDNSVIIDKSYHGVRLSYCLNEWAALGRVFPKAKEALLQKKDLAYENFIKTQSPHAFNEFSNICEYLNSSDEAITLFLEFHEADKTTSKQIFTFIYEALAAKSEWLICWEYFGNGYKQYQKVITLFDHCVKFANELQGEQRKKIEDESITTTKKEILWILQMLNHGGGATND